MITTKRCSRSAQNCRNLTSTIANVLACLAVMTSGGCVTNGTYNAAVKEARTVQGELERAKEEQRMLIREVSELEQLNAESMRETEVALAAVQEVKRDADMQRREAEQQQAKLRQKIPRLIRQHRVLQDDLAVARGNQGALQELIDVYKKKLADLEKERMTEPPPEVALAPKPFDPAALPPAQVLPEPIPAVEPPKQETVTAPPPAKAPVSAKPTPEPAESGWLSTIKDWIFSLWQSVFS